MSIEATPTSEQPRHCGQMRLACPVSSSSQSRPWLRPESWHLAWVQPFPLREAHCPWQWLSVPFFYLREHRNEFHVLRHVLLPAIPFILLAVVIYFQFVPLPPAPFNLVGPIDAVWLVLGIIIVVLLSSRAPKVLTQGNKLFNADDERP